MAQERVNEVVNNHLEQKKLYDILFKQNNEAIILHNEVRRVFKEESEAFFTERLKWKTDVQAEMEKQNKRLNECVRSADNLSLQVSDAVDSLSMITDSIVLLHMVQENICKDMTRVNLMGTKAEKDIMHDVDNSQ